MNKPLFEVEGFDKLQEQIRKLADDKDKKSEVLQILRYVARPTVAVAKAEAPVQNGFARSSLKSRKSTVPGTLKKSIGTITGKQENPTILVGPRARGAYKGWYGAMVHDGHNIYHKGFRRVHQGGGINNHAAKSRTTANKYMDRAYKITDAKVTKDAEKQLAAFIQRRIDKL